MYWLAAQKKSTHMAWQNSESDLQRHLELTRTYCNSVFHLPCVTHVIASILLLLIVILYKGHEYQIKSSTPANKSHRLSRPDLISELQRGQGVALSREM